jgi:hypothetical protein
MCHHHALKPKLLRGMKVAGYSVDGESFTGDERFLVKKG